MKQAKKRNTRISVLKANDELYTQQLLSSHRFVGSNGEYYVFEEDFKNQNRPSNQEGSQEEMTTNVIVKTSNTSPLRVKPSPQK